MTEEQADFWQSHSLKFLEMAFRTDRQETVARPDGFGEKTGQCGDTIAFYLTLDGDRIGSVSFRINGCIFTNACANACAELAEGRTLADAWEISPDTLADYLETLPDDHYHCAELAVGAFYLALANSREVRRAPWKKLYQ